MQEQPGTCGRDGDPAETMLLFDGQDVARARHWLSQSTAPSAQQRVMRMRLEEMVDALSPYLLSTADRISARLGFRRADEQV